MMPNPGSSVIPPPTDKHMVVPAPEPTIMQMLDSAVQSGKSIEYLKELMALRAELVRQELEARMLVAQQQYDEEMINAKRQLPTSIGRGNLASFDTQKGSTSYTYASLDDILEAVVPILAANHLRHLYTVAQSEDQVTVTCIMRHRSGFSESVDMNGPYDRSGSKNAIQALGSTVTYLKKYTLLALLGIAAGEDDDGRLAAAARAPRVGPDPMVDNRPPEQQAKPEPLSAEEKERVIEQAKLAAKQGEDVFRGFFVNLSNSRRAALGDEKLRLELRQLMNEADSATAAARSTMAAAVEEQGGR